MNNFDRYTQENALAAVDETLRLLASQPAPEGLEDRLQRQLRLHSAQRPGVFARMKDELAERFRFLSLDGATMRAVAAVAIAAVVLGGGWSVSSRVQLAPQGSAIQQRGGGGFSSAGAIRTPQNIEGPVVVVVPVAQMVVTTSVLPNQNRRGNMAGKHKSAAKPVAAETK
jgi:anti-sigma factor RsiW